VNLRRTASPPLNEPTPQSPKEQEPEPTRNRAAELAALTDLDANGKHVLRAHLAAAADLDDDENLSGAIKNAAAELERTPGDIARHLALAEARAQAFEMFLSRKGIPRNSSRRSRRQWEQAAFVAEAQLSQKLDQLAAIERTVSWYAQGPLRSRHRRLTAQIAELEWQTERYWQILHPPYANCDPIPNLPTCDCGEWLDREEAFSSGGYCPSCLRAARLVGAVAF
jgi:hypothetical protein